MNKKMFKIEITKSTRKGEIVFIYSPNTDLDVTQEQEQDFLDTINYKLRDIVRYIKKIEGNNIEIGDSVRVVDNNQLYTTFKDWFKDNKLGKYYNQYAFGFTPDNGDILKVVEIAPHHEDCPILVYLCEKDLGYGFKCYFLMNIDGIDKVEEE